MSESVITYQLDDQVGFKLGRAFTKAHDNLRQRIVEFDVTPQQMTVIMRLLEQGEVSQNNLGRLVGMKPATIHGIVKRMEARGIMVARRSPDDQRLTLVALTEKGRSLGQRLMAHSEAASSETLQQLSPDDQQTLKNLLDKLI